MNRTHGYAYRGEGITKALSFLEDFDQWSKHPSEHIDHRLGRLHETRAIKVYCPDRWIIGQASNRSDIDGRDHGNRYWFSTIRRYEAPLPSVPKHRDRVRVGIYIPSIHVGGVEVWARTLLSHLDPARFLVSGICVDQDADGPSLPMPWPITRHVKSLANNSDVIMVWGVKSARGLRNTFKGPIVCISHGACEWTETMLKRIAPLSDHYTAVSNIASTAYEEQYRSKVTVIPNGIHRMGFPDREKARALLGIGDRLAVGYIGRYSPEKHPLMAARAVSALPNAVAVYHGYDFTGTGWEDQIKEAAHGRVIFRGPEQRTEDTYAAIDVFLHAPEMEPFGLTYLEAMQAGVPVVSTNTGVIKECGEDVAVLVSHTDSPDVLGEAVLEAIKREKVETAKRVANEQYSLKSMTNGWERLLWNAVGKSEYGHIDHKDVPGMFNFQMIYRRAAEAMRDGAVCVEVGCYLGQSTSYLAIEGLNLHREFQLWAVDTWKGTPGEHQQRDYMPDFIANMQRGYNLIGTVKPLRMESVKAAHLFRDQSIDFIYLDGDHSYEAVKADIAAWLPKCRGVIAGHDYTAAFPGVIQAVTEQFGEVQVDPVSSSWAVVVGQPPTFDSRSFMWWDRSFPTAPKKRVYKPGEKRPRKIPQQLLAT